MCAATTLDVASIRTFLAVYMRVTLKFLFWDLMSSINYRGYHESCDSQVMIVDT